MNTFVLVLILSGSLSGGKAMEKVEGYISKEACIEAGEQFRGISHSFVCIPAPKKDKE